MARRTRNPFYLVFSKDPPAVDVVKHVDLIPLAAPVGAEAAGTADDISFEWEKTKDVIEIVKGRILDKGFKKDMTVRAKKVCPSGEFIVGDDISTAIGTRRQELEKMRMRQVNAQKLQLQERAEDLLDNPGVCLQKHTMPTVQRRCRLPKKRTATQLAEVQQKVKNLPCQTKGPNKTQIWKNKDIYLPSGELTISRMRYKKQPKSLFLALLHLALPDEILIEDGFSATGSRYCAGPPEDLLPALSLYIGGVLLKAGGDINTIDFDPVRILTTLIGNTRKKYGKFVDRGELPEVASTLAQTPQITQTTQSAHSSFTDNSIHTSYTLNTPCSNIPTHLNYQFPNYPINTDTRMQTTSEPLYTMDHMYAGPAPPIAEAVPNFLSNFYSEVQETLEVETESSRVC